MPPAPAASPAEREGRPRFCPEPDVPLTSTGKSFYLRDVLPLPAAPRGHDVGVRPGARRVPVAQEASEGDPGQQNLLTHYRAARLRQRRLFAMFSRDGPVARALVIATCVN